MYGRSRLVRLLIEKEQSDQFLATSERDHWYSVDFQLFNNSNLKDLFTLGNYDDETEEFLNNSFEISNSVCVQSLRHLANKKRKNFLSFDSLTIMSSWLFVGKKGKIYYSFMASLLSFFFTKTNINGILGRGSMFLFSRQFLQKFLNLPSDWSSTEKRLIDIGAGDGTITLILQHLFKDVTAVEASKIMEWHRHYAPSNLLKNLHSLALENNCFVLLSVVLPLNIYVEFNFDEEKESNDLLFLPFSKNKNLIKNSFEKHAEILIKDVLIPAGFEIVKWSKLPYFSEGDLSRAFYKLDDAIFLLKAV
ncbi:hypothetical protein Mgra_00006196 [Meloidogyne graminicola]|uniref:Uncharacterized protein n=1 Tax=Meloidogyne graminicola TaxID=189291 RepID=A0A8S9ZM96_9BILA|nr:hypothetical protein Mgra_00006196 [Meloidogyne graminicola]